jgi:hypothetical protein
MCVFTSVNVCLQVVRHRYWSGVTRYLCLISLVTPFTQHLNPRSLHLLISLPSVSQIAAICSTSSKATRMVPSNAELMTNALIRTRKIMRAAYDKTKGPLHPLGLRQTASRKDRGPPPSIWTSQITLSIPAEDDANNAVEAAVRNLTDVNTPPLSLSLKSAPVEAEWVSIKRSALAAENDTPKSHFDALSRDTQSNCTVLFVHGGGYL